MTIRRALLLSLVAICLWSQDRFPVTGKVINEATGLPVARAKVNLNGFVPGPDGNVRGTSIQQETFTAVGGAFRFESLPKGNFTITATKPQFETNHQTEVTAGADNVVVRLRPLAVVEGYVTDSAGRPMQGVQMRAQASEVMNGRKNIRQLRTVATDDRGYYRFWNLSAGKIYLKAAGRSGGTAFYIANLPPSFVGTESFVPVYHDGNETLESAKPLEIGAGQQIQADFRLRLLPAYKIRGVVRNLQPYKPAKVELLLGSEDLGANRASLNANTGAFEVNDVMPGTYRLRVMQGQPGEIVMAEGIVTVSSTNVDRVELHAAGGMELRVKTELTGEPHAIIAHGRLPSTCSVIVESAMDSRPMYPKMEDSELRFTGLPPGEYFIRPDCGDGYVTSMMLGPVDVLAAGKLTLSPGSASLLLTINGTRNAGKMTIELEGEAVGKNLQALLVPNFPTAEGPKVVHLNDAKGFAMGLAPGSYTAFLVDERTLAYRHPEVVSQLRNGVNVTVSLGDMAKVTLKEAAQ